MRQSFDHLENLENGESYGKAVIYRLRKIGLFPFSIPLRFKRPVHSVFLDQDVYLDRFAAIAQIAQTE